MSQQSVWTQPVRLSVRGGLILRGGGGGTIGCSPCLPNCGTSFNRRITTPWSLRRPLVFLPRTCTCTCACTCVIPAETRPIWAEVIRRTHAMQAGGRPTRGDAIVSCEVEFCRYVDLCSCFWRIDDVPAKNLGTSKLGWLSRAGIVQSASVPRRWRSTLASPR